MRYAIIAAIALAGCASLTGGPNGRSDDMFRQITPGWSEAEVLKVAGKPDDTMYFPRTDTHSWGYQYYDAWGYLAEFSVTFDAGGRAVSKFSRRITDGGDHGGK